MCTVIQFGSFFFMWYSGATCWLNATLALYSGHLSIVDKTPGPTGVHYGQVLLLDYGAATQDSATSKSPKLPAVMIPAAGRESGTIGK